MSSATVRGRFVWHELMTTDTEAAASFYSRVVGWKTQAWPQDSSYTMFVAKGGPMAGLMVLPEDVKAMGAPPNWLIYIGTPDVDETARLAAEMGGRIRKEPTDIPSVGRFAVIEDPQGAVFAAFTPSQGPMGDGKPTIGDFSWHELATTDWQAALAFYQRLFGWEKTESMDRGPEMGTYQMFGWKGMTLGGMFDKPKSMPAPPHWLPYVAVPDATRAAGIVKELGGRVINGPMEVPGGGWIAQCVDLQGAVFAVHSWKPATAEPAARKPAAKKPAARKPAAKKPAARKPAAKKPAAKKPAAKKPAAKKPAAKKPAGKKPARKKPAARKPVARKKAAKAKAKKRAARKPAKKAKTGRKATARRVAPRPKATKKITARRKRR